jgi:hypothetical protein
MVGCGSWVVNAEPSTEVKAAARLPRSEMERSFD